MKLTKGTILKAKGGWDAEVVWIAQCGFYAMHLPEKRKEATGPIWHDADGKAAAVFVVNEPPSFNGHPADLEMGEYEL